MRSTLTEAADCSATAEAPWWLAAPSFKEAVERQASAPLASMYFQLGEAVLEISTDDAVFLERFDQLYGEAAVARPSAPNEPRVRCVVRRATPPAPISLTFLKGAPPDPAAGALSLMQPTGVMPPYSVYDSPVPGWRLAGSATRPVVTVNGAHVLIDSEITRPDFLVEYLVSATLAAQPGLLIAHAASLRIGDGAVLLIGPTHSGKTTMCVHMGARGHAVFGDDAAVIRLSTAEVIPWRQTTRLRSGPRSPEVTAALSRLTRTHDESVRIAGESSMLFQVSELFPGAPPRPAKLRAAFFLSGFAAEPSLAPFQFTLQYLDSYDCLADSDMAYKWWGLGHAQRALRLLALKQVLASLPSWRLMVGPPAETARLIEQTMEAL